MIVWQCVHACVQTMEKEAFRHSQAHRTIVEDWVFNNHPVYNIGSLVNHPNDPILHIIWMGPPSLPPYIYCYVLQRCHYQHESNQLTFTHTIIIIFLVTFSVELVKWHHFTMTWTSRLATEVMMSPGSQHQCYYTRMFSVCDIILIRDSQFSNLVFFLPLG